MDFIEKVGQLLPWFLAPQSVILGPAASASFRSLLRMQNLYSHPKSTDSVLIPLVMHVHVKVKTPLVYYVWITLLCFTESQLSFEVIHFFNTVTRCSVFSTSGPLHVRVWKIVFYLFVHPTSLLKISALFIWHLMIYHFRIIFVVSSHRYMKSIAFMPYFPI